MLVFMFMDVLMFIMTACSLKPYYVPDCSCPFTIKAHSLLISDVTEGGKKKAE